MPIELKYIVTDRNDFAIFTSLSSHKDVARGLYGKPVGAGFIRLAGLHNDEKFLKADCYGESVSLGLES